jgi:hypothetical protein
MRTLRLFMLSLLVTAATAAAHAEEPLAALPAAMGPSVPPAMYSFADVYRLTVAGVPLGSFAFADSEPQVRVATQSAISPEPRFSISTARETQRWLLALAGIALAAWVAHRRLTSPF